MSVDMGLRPTCHTASLSYQLSTRPYTTYHSHTVGHIVMLVVLHYLCDIPLQKITTVYLHL